MGQNKSNDKKTKNKSHRAHVIVQGNLNNLAQQDQQDPSLGIPTDYNPHLTEQWDPNEEMAPDFLEGNEVIVPETQDQREHEDGAR